MSQTQSLFPVGCKNMVITGDTTASTSAALPAAGGTIHFFNEGPANAWVSVGVGAQVATLPATTGAAATLTSFPVPVGAILTYGIPDSDILQISAITRTGQAVINCAVNRGC